MEGNPYTGLWDVLRGGSGGPKGLMMSEGTVVSVSPVKVSAWGEIFAGAELRINAQLLAGWKQTVSLKTDTAVTAGEETVTAGTLKAGDRVICLTGIIQTIYDDSQQTIYVLCKVVSG